MPQEGHHRVLFILLLMMATRWIRCSSSSSSSCTHPPRTTPAAFASFTSAASTRPSPPPDTQDDKLRIAIIGGGLAGLSTAWHLLNHDRHHIKIKHLSIFDPCPPGHAHASSVAGGLLHPLTPKNRLIWAGREGFEATSHLLAASKAALLKAGEEGAVQRLHSPSGAILRPALTPQHVTDYQKAAAALPEWMEWLEGEEWQKRANTYNKGGGGGCGLLLHRSIVISMPDYLRGLWLSLQQQAQAHTDTHAKISWESRTLSSLTTHAKEDHGEYDVLVLASGAGIRNFPELKSLPVELVRGRTLLIEDDQHDPLQSALLCGEYVVPGWDALMGGKSQEEEGKGKRVLRCGATREYIKDPWGSEVGREEEGGEKYEKDEKIVTLRDKAQKLYAPLEGRPAPYAITTGIRVATKRSNLGKLPIVGKLSLSETQTQSETKVNEKEKEEKEKKKDVWLYTGLGGRGMIHHAYLGKALAAAILEEDESLLPPEVRAPLAAAGGGL